MKLIIANWKANPTTKEEVKEYFNNFKTESNVVFCPPFLYLDEIPYTKGAQNCFWEDKGAYTGEITPAMLKDVGCEYVIIGHSERRRYFKEEKIKEKIQKAKENGLKVVLCIGEQEGQDRLEIIKSQLADIDLSDIIIAYEPIWAIGTGNACDKETAEFALKEIKEIAVDNKILYGGSVNKDNYKDYDAFDGLLIGGASLKPEEFQVICNQEN